MSTPRTDAQAGWAIANQYGQSTASELLGATDGVFVHAVFARTLERELIAITAERDQLRAEVERLTKQIKDDNRSYGCELRDPNGTIWQQATKDHARAERAEAELAAAKERLRSEAMDDYASIKNAARELATERARVRVLRKALENVKDSICRNVPDGYSQPCVDESADECDKIIDAAMKEGVK